VKHAFPRSLASAGPSLLVHVSRFDEQRCSGNGETSRGASKPAGWVCECGGASPRVHVGITRRCGFSWARARVSRSRSDASRSWRSVAGRHAGNARPSSQELHGNTSDGGRAASASESVQSAHTVVPKTAYAARSARESSRVLEVGLGPFSQARGFGVGGLETNGVRARRSWLDGRRFGA